MTNARDLALELSQLPAGQRETLLAELPADRRRGLEALMVEIAGLLAATPDSFERHLEKARAEPSVRWIDDIAEDRLQLLLDAEPASVRQRVAAAMRNRDAPQFPPAVDAIVAEYLSRRMQMVDMHGAGTNAPRRWWHRWRSRRA